MKNELQKHKTSDKIKWAFTFVAFVLVFVMFAGLCMQLFGTGKVKPSEWFKKSESESTEICNHENVVTVYGKVATYTETGLTDGIKCADCGFILVKQQEVPVLDASVLITETVLISDYAIANSWVNAKKYDTVNLGANITVSIDGGVNSGKFYEGSQWRLYQSENASLIVSAKEGYGIFNICISYYFVNGGTLTNQDGTVSYSSNTDIVLNGEQSFIFGVATSDEPKQGQVKITAIEIQYGLSSTVNNNSEVTV